MYEKTFPSFPMHKFSMLFLFIFVPQQILKFLFMFHFLNLDNESLVSIYFSRDSLCFISFDVIIRQGLKKKLKKLVELFFQSYERSKNMWSYAIRLGQDINLSPVGRFKFVAQFCVSCLHLKTSSSHTKFKTQIHKW